MPDMLHPQRRQCWQGSMNMKTSIHNPVSNGLIIQRRSQRVSRISSISPALTLYSRAATQIAKYRKTDSRINVQPSG